MIQNDQFQVNKPVLDNLILLLDSVNYSLDIKFYTTHTHTHLHTQTDLKAKVDVTCSKFTYCSNLGRICTKQ